MQFQCSVDYRRGYNENRTLRIIWPFRTFLSPFLCPPRLLYFLSIELSLTVYRCSTNYVAAIHDVMTRVFRLWAEVFHVNSSGGGTVKWQQVSEDLVPVNITCIQDSPECVFHITAYNSQVDKILDVRLVQPGEP